MVEFVLPSEEEVKDRMMNILVDRILRSLDKNTVGDEGTDYKPLYYRLNRGITTIIEYASTYEQAIEALKQLQCMVEDAFVMQAE